jgi:hypothetical protein
MVIKIYLLLPSRCARAFRTPWSMGTCVLRGFCLDLSRNMSGGLSGGCISVNFLELQNFLDGSVLRTAFVGITVQ